MVVPWLQGGTIISIHQAHIYTRNTHAGVYTGQSTSREKEKGDAVPALKEGVGEYEKKEAAERLDHNIDLAARDDGMLTWTKTYKGGNSFLGLNPASGFAPAFSLSFISLLFLACARTHIHTHQ